MARRSRTRWKWITASLLITLTLAVPLSTFLLPSVHRWYMLNKLISESPESRLEGQKYFLSFAEKDPDVLAGGIERLNAAPEAAFRELVWTIDQAGFWERVRVGDEPWLRWLEWVAADGDPDARLMAPQIIADDAALVLTERTQRIVAQLASDADAGVRYNTLVAVAEMHGIAAAANDSAAVAQFIKTIHAATHDADPVISRQAWMFCGLLRQLPADESNTTTIDHAASLWARATVEQKGWTDRAKRLLNTPEASNHDRAMAAYLLVRHADQPTPQLLELIAKGPLAITTDNQLITWRSILGLQHVSPVSKVLPAGVTVGSGAGDIHGTVTASDFELLKGFGLSTAHPSLVAFLKKVTPEQLARDPLRRPVVLAAAHRGRVVRLPLETSLNDPASPEDDAQADRSANPSDPLLKLAFMEGLDPTLVASPIKLTITPTDTAHSSDPEMLRLALFRIVATDKLDVRPFMSLFLSESPEIRDAACITAFERLSTDQCAAIVRALWRRPRQDDSADQPIYIFDDHAKISGAMLAGLADVEPDALDRMTYDFSERWLVRDMMHLAQWMQNRPPPGKNVVSYMSTMLIRDDVPRSTILLGLLKRRSDIALDYLLTPRGDLNQDLIALLEQFRWWHVLNHHLPADAPRLELWGDPELIAFQVDLLRNWYALNRYQIAKSATK